MLEGKPGRRVYSEANTSVAKTKAVTKAFIEKILSKKKS